MVKVVKDVDFKVAGFVKNEGSTPYFMLQRALPPGGKISFVDAHKVLGKKSGTSGEEFVKWLRSNVFPGSEWGFYNGDSAPFFTAAADVAPVAPPVSEESANGAGKVLKRDQKKQVSKGTEITASSIIEANFPQADVLIESCRSRDILKKALALSQHFSNKSEHMRKLMRRLEQVQ